MSGDGLNTIGPVAAQRWITKIESKKDANKSAAALGRQELSLIYDLAESDGLNRKALKRVIARREFERKEESQDASSSEEDREQLELLNESIGDLPLGSWAVTTAAPTEGSSRKSAAIPGAVPDPDQLTLAEAKAILAAPKKRGRQSDAAKARRTAAERVVAEADREAAENAGPADGASGAKAHAIADALEEIEGLEAGSSNDERALRPGFLRDGDAPEATSIN